MVNRVSGYENDFSKITTSNRMYKNTNMTEEEYAFYRKTNEFRRRLRQGESLRSIAPEALALCREAIKRGTKKTGGKALRAYDVQIEAALAMQGNNIVEMKTGEGKSLVQILCAYLNALEATKSENRNEWKSVHVLTANDYLAKRDEKDNHAVYSLLGLSSAYAMSNSQINSDPKKKKQKQNAYKCDIVYSTAQTVAFDYLSDHLVYDKNDKYINRVASKAIVDEADDILLDQANKPLILSGSEKLSNDPITNPYIWATNFINGEGRTKGRTISCIVFDKYEKHKYDNWNADCAVYMDEGSVHLSDSIMDEIENSVSESLPDREAMVFRRIETVKDCIKAEYLYKNGERYIVEDNQVILIDLNTGRRAPKSKLRDGMQEAIEYKEDYKLRKRTNGKERIKISKKTVAQGKCTYPDFLKTYTDGVSGMTGTSDEEEFSEIYDLSTYKVPTRIPNVRVDEEDELYVNQDTKFKAIVNDVLRCQQTGQPVLIGTLSPKESDELCKYLKDAGVRFQRLDAVNNKNENLVKQTAGLFGSVTVATNMAGRGIDIKLGDGVREVGGLYVIGASKNKNKRIDDQLRGRASRQGQPGKTKYYMSLDDDMVKTGLNQNLYFATKLADKDGRIRNDKAIEIVNKCQINEESRAKAGRKEIEKRAEESYTPRKKEIYEQRDKILESSDIELMSYISSISTSYVNHILSKDLQYEDASTLLKPIIGSSSVVSAYSSSRNKEELRQNLLSSISDKVKFASSSPNYFETVRKKMLKSIDSAWQDYIYSLDRYEESFGMNHYGGANLDKNTYREETDRIYMDFIESLQNELLYSVVTGTGKGIKSYRAPEVEGMIK